MNTLQRINKKIQLYRIQSVTVKTEVNVTELAFCSLVFICMYVSGNTFSKKISVI